LLGGFGSAAIAADAKAVAAVDLEQIGGLSSSRAIVGLSMEASANIIAWPVSMNGAGDRKQMPVG
jgi:hypothetical protein